MESFSFFSALILGLVAGTSSCLAVAGGLLISVIGKKHEHIGMMDKKSRLNFTYHFVAGRLIGYGVLGGLIGLLGSTFTFSPTLTGAITLLAAAYMIIAGLEMLHICPNWLRCAIPRPPKWLSHKILDADGNTNAFAPFMLGAATFFLPCGFTQSLQIYALTTGSFWTSAIILFAFALGTAPALLALGYASGSLQSKKGKWFLKGAAVFLIYLACINVQNGMTLLGYPLTFAKSSASAFESTTSGGGYRVVDPNAPKSVTTSPDGSTQIVDLTLTGKSPYYAPSNEITVRAGVPVKLVVNGRGTGCRGVFQIPKLGVQLSLSSSKNITEFIPEKPGTYVFSCSMGMYPGSLTVI